MVERRETAKILLSSGERQWLNVNMNMRRAWGLCRLNALYVGKCMCRRLNMHIMTTTAKSLFVVTRAA